VLVDDGFVLWESCAIMQYLADSKPGQTVYPQIRWRAPTSTAGCSGPASTSRRRKKARELGGNLRPCVGQRTEELESSD
jgi:glutathione S-transferase